ncbi:MAG: hypothetical protein GX871_06220 [Microbacteriaceae bacterium]|jgi:cytochrome c-type biogenesis protein CcmH/NrfF|nr:hypothetical protein [Microbacteriaceae bacterium]HOA86574.1 hypothetical protein [Microbacteriaceae bacterium]HPZ34359.1 hypothetical protein [Microbacteriaceae bacterium]HQC93283.1 hypothetical protein [Microbacteriaceae bacterium]
MRNYLFGTGIIGAITGGLTLLRGLREGEFTWRTALAWASWGITLALAIGAMVDVRRASHGQTIPHDTTLSEKEQRRLAKQAARSQR